MRQDTTGTPLMLLLAAVVNGSALALILWQAKRAGVQPYYQPPAAVAQSEDRPAGAGVPSRPVPSALIAAGRRPWRELIPKR